MFIVWGTKIRHKPAGFVAEHCPSCRQVAVHEFREVREIGHIYYISAGSGKVVGFDVKCGECGDIRVTEINRYASIMEHEVSVEEMIEQTTPQLLEEIADRLEREENTRRGRLEPEQRLAMIAAPFLSIAPTVQQRAVTTIIDSQSGWSLAAAFALPIGLIIVSANLPPNSKSTEAILMNAAWMSAVALFAFALYSLASDVRRFIERQYWRFLVSELRIVEPTLQEIKDVLRSLKKQKYAVGKFVRARKLHRDLTEPPIGPGS